VHTSNFRIIGFTKEVSRTELAALAHTFGLPLIEDLGSGTLFDFLAAGFPHLRAEPTAAQVLAGGADVLTFSGDKMLGGPQSGIIAGKAEYIERIARNPLIRALRIDKLSLAALEATLRLYRDPDLAAKCIPTLRRMTMSADLLRHRAGKLARLLKKVLPVQDGDWGVYLRQSTSRTGGGAFPEQDLPTWLAVITSSKAGFNPNTLRQALLHANPPLVVRVEDDAVCLDPRTLEDTEFPLVAQAVSASITL
jgi:L-seryl-tRNA(Ser) seleniumtransferase